MATLEQQIMRKAASNKTKGMWQKAQNDIFYFIEHYVPKNLFDLDQSAPQQRDLFQAVQDGLRYFVIRAPRKGGKTICVAIIVVWLTLRDQTYRIFIISGGKDQAEWLYDYCKQILWPPGDKGRAARELFSQFLTGEPSKTRLTYKKGGWIRYAAASEKQVNAPTADGLVNDEYVLIPQGIVQAAWPMIRGSDKPMRFLLSTATPGKENTDSFIDILDAAEPGQHLYKQGWRSFVWRDTDCPFLQRKNNLSDAEVAKFFLDDEMYRTQYQGLMPKRAGRVFPRTLIREAFVKPDPKNPGFLLDGTPYDPQPAIPGDGYTPIKLVFRGESKAGVDWGFDHDTVFLEGYRNLDHKMVAMKMHVDHGTSASDWGNIALEDSMEYEITEWLCDSAGAFQNQELSDLGLNVKKRVFGHISDGKEWMIGIAYYWLQKKLVVIPDTEDFALLKKQLGKYKRDGNGKPVKGYDHCVDAFLCWLSGWDPRYYDPEREIPPQPKPAEQTGVSNKWEEFRSGTKPWLPDNWADNEMLRREPWEKR